MPSMCVAGMSSAACVARPNAKAAAANGEGAAAAAKKERDRWREINARGGGKVMELSQARKMMGS
eukprot:4937449-Pyramimonas_sp.AAC.1